MTTNPLMPPWLRARGRGLTRGDLHDFILERMPVAPPFTVTVTGWCTAHVCFSEFVPPDVIADIETYLRANLPGHLTPRVSCAEQPRECACGIDRRDCEYHRVTG